MARITVEDSMPFVESRFELVMLAATRARALAAGATSELPPERDKNTVIALREIEEQSLTTDALREQMVGGLQNFIKAEVRTDSEAQDAMESETSALQHGVNEGLVLDGLAGMAFEDVDIND